MIDAHNVADAVLRREPGAIARAISLVENNHAAAVDVLQRLHAHTGNAFVIGITGPPGAGKSTLVDHLSGALRDVGLQVGIIAVDPTSPFTGGALLGDRIRMQSRSNDPGIFIRSMASRGSLGGLSVRVPEAIQVLDAAGYEALLVETVGVGQAEVDVARTVDVCVLVLVPGLGDDVQALKAGIMEIGDIFVLNKSDRQGAAELRRQVEFFLSFSDRKDGWVPPIVDTVATEGRGIDTLLEKIQNFRQRYDNSDFRQRKRFESARQHLLTLLRERLLHSVLETEDERLVDEWVGRIVRREVDVYTAVSSLMRRRIENGVGS